MIKILKKRKWDKKKVIKELRLFANSLSKTPKEYDFRQKGNFNLFKASIRYFGSYTQALEEINLKPNKRYWSKDKIILEFKKIVFNLGYVPTYRDLIKLKRHDILSAIRRHFENKYNVVVKKCGFQPNNIRWDNTKVKEELIKLSKKYMRTPTEREIRREISGLFGASVKYFGSLNKALKFSCLKTNQSFVKNDLWKYWESFIIRVLKSLNENVVIHPRLPNKTIPDAMIGSKIIEVKLNVAQEYILKDIKNYLPYAKKMEVWHLYGIPKIKNKRVEYIGPKKIEKILKSNKQKNLLNNLYLLKRGVKC